MTKTHWSGILIGLLLLAGLQSCYILDGFFVEEPPAKEQPLQERCEKAVSDYIISKKGSEYYKPFGFSKIIIHKPVELVELEELEQDRKANATPDAAIDSLIQQKKNFILANRIERTVELSHFFTLKGKPDFITVLESKYILNDTLGVIDLYPVIILEMPIEYEEVLNFYFFEYTLFNSTDYTDGRKISNEFYAFFKSHLDELPGVQVKSVFLFHTLKIMKQVKESGAFDPQLVTEKLVKERMADPADPMPEYEARQFSPLYEKRNGDNIAGYYIFHKFIGRLNEVSDLFVYRFDFSPYFEIESFAKMDEAFETYLNN